MNIIQTHDLCKQYGSALRVSHLNLNVPEGSIYGFLGPNGAGKSTTLKMILGLVRPTAGSIRVLGKDMDNSNRLSVLRQVGSLIESPSYYGHLTGEENLRIVQTLRGIPEKNIREVLQIVRLDGQREKKVAHYSLGMKQRLGLAAALLGYPKLLILDALHGRSRHHLALRTTNNTVARSLLAEQSVPCEEENGYLILPILSDEVAAKLTRFLADSRLGVVRLEERQKSLEDIFLDLTGKAASL